MSRLPQMWNPDQHPRWPSKAPAGKGGQFREQHDWATRAGDLPIAGGGSIATGKVEQCDKCGRTVRVVGNGRLSTHNAEKGRRCEGSGAAAGAGGGGTLRQTRSRARSKVPPSVKRQPPTVAIPLDLGQTVTDSQAQRRLADWRQDARSPGRAPRPTRTVRDREIEHVKQNLAYTRRNLESNRKYEKARLEHDMRAEGYNPDSPRDRENWGYDDELKRRLRMDLRSVEHQENMLEALQAGGSLDSYWARFGVRTDAAELDAPDSHSVQHFGAAQQFDPERPLAVYGDMLHFDDTWLSYVALDSLERRVPPEYHAAMAEYLAEMGGGMWFSGSQTIPSLDSLHRLRGQQPRGWEVGKTWDDVDGVVSGGSTLAVTNTANTRSHRYSRQSSRSSAGLPSEGVDPSATLHEFGHLVDAALGKRLSGGYERASQQRGWRMLYNEVAAEAGAGLNPYFRQHKKGSKKLDVESSSEELWADVFGTWVSVDEGSAGGTFTYFDGKKPGVAKPLTGRIRLIAATYDVPYSTAYRLNEYFKLHAKEVRLGKRRPLSYDPRRR